MSSSITLTTFSLLEKESITTPTTLHLWRYFGNSAEFWMRLQAGYDLAIAERDFGEKVMREVEAA